MNFLIKAEEALPNYSDLKNPDGSPVNFIFQGDKGNVGSIISALIPYIYLIAGLSLFLMLIWGGITLMTAAGNPDQSKAGYGRITGALIGFVVIFISYFLVQLIEIIFGIKIL